MKLCKDCKYFKYDANVPRCTHESNKTATDMVFGHVAYYTCESNRSTNAPGCCGMDAKLFEQKEQYIP